MSNRQEINTKDMVDVIIAVLDTFSLLNDFEEDQMQYLCECLQINIDKFIGEEE